MNFGGQNNFHIFARCCKKFRGAAAAPEKKNKSPLEASFPERRHHELQPGTFRDFLTKRKKMGLTAAAVGGLLGFSAQCMSNAIQKIPLSRRKSENFGEKDGLFPFFKSEILIWLDYFLFSLFLAVVWRSLEPWMHVMCTVGGAWAVNRWFKFEADLLNDVNEIRAYRGLPPMVGSHHWIPFVPPTFKDQEDKSS